ncbi:MAG: glycoside hydrolase family 3 C-terminal domain-containing protein [Candidatus Brocadiia bacterium]
MATEDWRDPDLPVEQRVEDLLSRMTREEKVSQMVHTASGIERLGVPPYDWWNECLHGVARAGKATVFPQAIGMAASFDAELMGRVATAISDEARAKHHAALRNGSHARCFGLTFWSPNVNIFRDPRWGRGQETYGEDPYLMARMGVAFCQGLQGDDPRYLKVVATPKHYVVHSGREADRHHFDARVSQRDLRETYLPAFKACVQEGGAWSVMGAYNRTNGEPCSASKTLLQDILREEWGFEGYVVSDCGAINDIHAHHKVTDGPAESAAMAVRNGCDLNCGGTFPHLMEALERGLIEEETVDRSLRRLLEARFRLGMFDPPERVPYARIPEDVVDCAGHRELALQMARESIVLLKNEGDLLPLPKDLKRIAVVGPCADTWDALRGNYHGLAARYVTLLMGILDEAGPGTDVQHIGGSGLVDEEQRPEHWGSPEEHAAGADVIVAVLGLTPRLEGEEGATDLSEDKGDRVHIGLPPAQEDLLRKLHATGKPVVLVLTGGSPLAIPWAAENIPAILMAWYGGQAGGQAVGEVLFGDYNPAGRLPLTFVKGLEQLPPFEDYAMQGRTYRFMDEEPLFRFGYGLSYTTFAYSDLKLSAQEVSADEPVTVRVTVRNTGERSGDEVVQLYVSDVEASVPVPRHHLEGFRRVHLEAGEERTVSLALLPEQLVAYDDGGNAFVEPGEFVISVGGGQPDDPAAGALQSRLTVVG